MSIFHAMNNSASALTAQRLRMDVASSNMANANTTRATLNENGEWEPYRRKMVVFQPSENKFSHFLHKAAHHPSQGSGVKATDIKEDKEPFKLVYNPNHPDSNPNGYVKLPNVDPLKEMVDMMSATRSYEANVTSVNASKSMLTKALEIGR
ncbi:flagellar basal-body rod protein FlgC [Halobacillus karajensis]|uniref:Flagellar basal-body rod protein FlgC n=1 Tax=Halobacillus karajensis TaxID=195088 RepID=A0A024P3J8_9BACI|nr:flagellar basal body rod protein FlgC [Halobacillus karajensis]CDQ19747.1 Putative proximal rod protein [Halobacillus karajensis]CDQ22207.1 Putative proximal rod protein [Halobacillus karajensis]CDQ28048.1 Putative proximal rod protein [Halobacillus karajensis]SEH72843.1 flagellar basal-body rod protein FlgC [Halobacillus karajensis]